jgi:hypothetical protein
MDRASIKRIRAELATVGVGAVGLRTPEVKELAKMLHPDEHIGGVVYGRYSNGLGWLVATERRIIFIDKKPMFATIDELTYEAVSGVKKMKAGLLNSVELQTRIGDYTIRFVGTKCANIFVKYIEQRCLEGGELFIK